MQILVVDDNLVNLTITKKILEKLGCIVDTVDSGIKCLEQVINKTYDIIFMDIMMPEMDGVEALNNLRSIEGFNTPVVALTADAGVDSREKYLSLGFNEYIPKPINLEVMDSVVHKTF